MMAFSYMFSTFSCFRKPCLLAKITCGLTDKKFWIALKLSSASGAKCVFSPMWIFSYIFEWFFSPNAPISIENIELLLKCVFWCEEFSHGQKIFKNKEVLKFQRVYALLFLVSNWYAKLFATHKVNTGHCWDVVQVHQKFNESLLVQTKGFGWLDWDEIKR